MPEHISTSDTKRFFNPLIAAFLVVLAISLSAGAVAYYAYQLDREEKRKQLSDFLNHIKAEFQHNLQQQRINIAYWQIDTNLIQTAQSLLKGTFSANQPAFRQLDTELAPIIATQGYQDYKFLDADGRILFSRFHTENTHTTESIPKALLQKAWQGQIVISPPYLTKSKAEQSAKILILMPVKDFQQQTLMLFAFETDLDALVKNLITDNSIGKSGHIFFVNAKGQVLPSPTEKLTPTFIPDLYALKTKQARINLEGYQNNQAPPVIEGWLWIDALDIGVITELDKGKAFKNSQLLLNSIAIGALIAILLALLITWLFQRFQQKFINALQLQQIVFNNLSEGLIVINAQGIIKLINPAISRLFGYEEHELLGHNVKIIMPDSIAKHHDAYLQSVDLNKPKILNKTTSAKGKRKDDSTFPLNLTITPININSKLYFSAILRDLSDKTKLQSKILSTQKKLKDRSRELAFRVAAVNEHALVSISDLNGIITYANDKFCQTSGYKEEELLGKTHGILNSGEHPKSFFKDMWDTILSGKTWHGEIKNRTKQGQAYWVQATIVPYLDEQGKPERFIAIRTDITQQKILEFKLKHNKTRLALSHQFANIGTWEWDIQSNSIFWSEQVPVLFGLERGRLKTTLDKFLSLVHPDDVECINNTIQTSLESGITYDIEHRVIWPDGTVKWVHEKGNVIRNQKGKATRMLGVIIDIDKIKQTQLQLEQASRAKSEFLSSMSHELRTPLNAILGFAQLLQSDVDTPLNEDQQESVMHIYQSGQHLLDLINDILELSRIEAKKLEISHDIINIQDVMQACLPILKPLAEKKLVTLELLSSDRIYIVGDSTRLKQVVINLISNAIKYNKPEGRVSIRYEVLGDTLKIIVKDTGIGIPESKQAAVFQAFERLGQETSNIEGTGIGLVITKELVQAMGGDIGFESQEGKGSTFWIELPLANQNDLPENTYNTVETQTQSAENNHNTESNTILYVEDNPTNIRLIEGFFKQYPQIRLVTASSAEQALLLFEQGLQPDLILMDIHLPGLSGLELAEILKEHADFKAPIIGLSAAAMAEQIQEAQQTFDDYLTKPVDFVQLKQALQEHGIGL